MDGKKSTTVYADHNTPEGKKEYFRTKTFDLEKLMDEVGRYASITVFQNEREGKKSLSLIINESDAKYLPKDKSEDKSEDAPSSGSRPARRLDRV